MKNNYLLINLLLVPLFLAGFRSTDTMPVPKWKHLSTINGDIPQAGLGRQVAALIRDIDLDGKNDFLIASYEKIAWLRYNASDHNWTRYIIEPGIPEGSLEAGGAFYDINGDGSPDLVMGAAWLGKGCLWWWENPYPHFDTAVSWKRHLLARVGGQHHDQVFGDFLGSGKPQLVFWDNQSGRLFLAKIPGDPTQVWDPEVIAGLPTRRGNPEGLAIADINGDGKPDIVGGGWWFEHIRGDQFKGYPIDSTRQFSRTAVGQLVKGGRPEVVLNSGDDVGPLEMYTWEKNRWVGKILIDKMDHGHSLGIADINGDGNPDIFAAEMYDPGSGDSCRTFILYGDGKGNFTRQLLNRGIGSHESKLGDLNGDGLPDILQKDFQHKERIDIWLNQGITSEQ